MTLSNSTSQIEPTLFNRQDMALLPTTTARDRDAETPKFDAKAIKTHHKIILVCIVCNDIIQTRIIFNHNIKRVELVQFAARENILSVESKKHTKQNSKLQMYSQHLHQDGDTVRGIIILLFGSTLNHFANKDSILSAENPQKRTRKILRFEMNRPYTKMVMLVSTSPFYFLIIKEKELEALKHFESLQVLVLQDLTKGVVTLE